MPKASICYQRRLAQGTELEVMTRVERLSTLEWLIDGAFKYPYLKLTL